MVLENRKLAFYACWHKQAQTRWLGGIADSADMSMSKPREVVKDREGGHGAAHGVAESDAE